MTEENEQLLTPLQRTYLEANPEATLADETPVKYIEKKPLIGVGGWLKFLVISLFFLGPFFGFCLTLGDLSNAEYQHPELVGHPLWGQLKVVTWSFFAGQVAFSIYAAYRLQNRLVPSTIPIAIICLWIAGPILNILSSIVIGEMVGNSVLASNEVATSIFRSGLSAAIWTAYLLLSRRVRNTYRGGASEL